jgi:hypothetical protein
MAAIYSNGGNRWNILGFNFSKRDALSSLYKISMVELERTRVSHSSGLVLSADILRKIASSMNLCVKCKAFNFPPYWLGTRLRIESAARCEPAVLEENLLNTEQHGFILRH